MRYVARMRVPSDSVGSVPHDGATEIAAWAAERSLDAVVWTALPSNFASEVKKPFSTGEAVDYLKRRSAPAKVKAAEYIWRAPDFVRTPLRTAIEREPWFPKPE